jgi:hypothetical protein
MQAQSTSSIPTKASASAPLHRCQARENAGRIVPRLSRCPSRDTQLFQVGRLIFHLCSRHRWALLGVVERARESAREEAQA